MLHNVALAPGVLRGYYHNRDMNGNVKPQSEKLLAAFSVEHAARVTGLTKSRLTRWDKEGFFSPEYLDENDRGNPYARVYSFTDLVGLRTLAILVDDYKISLKELRQTYPELARQVKHPWSEKELSVWKKKVVWKDSDNVPRDRHGQLVGKHIELRTIASEVAQKAEALRNRNKALHGTTERRRHIAHNAEVVAGTRIPVKAVHSFIDAGYNDDQIMDEYPSLTKADVQFIRSNHKRAA